jgi:L,D-peptidoglycan transpeptidase YkuD (ErfK/YbiS/YcfS/YnhG family)
MKRRAILYLLVGALAASLALVTAPAEAADPVQMITVRAATSTSTTAVLEAWQRPVTGGPYTRMHAPIFARVGAQGVGQAREGRAVTPVGRFGLTEAYGRYGNPGTTVPYKVLDWSDWWVGDSSSRYYNQHYRCGGTVHCPFDPSVSERLMAYVPSYNYLTVINYNRWPSVPHAGSAFFLHVENGRATGGCVAVSQVDMIWLLRWMKKAYYPIIQISVG